MGTFSLPCSTKWMVLPSKMHAMKMVRSEKLCKRNWKNLNSGKLKDVPVNLYLGIIHRSEHQKVSYH